MLINDDGNQIEEKKIIQNTKFSLHISKYNDERYSK